RDPGREVHSHSDPLNGGVLLFGELSVCDQLCGLNGFNVVNVGDFLSQEQCGTFLCGVEILGFPPCGQGPESLSGYSGINGVTGMQVETVGTPIHLGYAKVNQLDELL